MIWTLFSKCTLSFLRQHTIKILFALVGITLGIGIYTAMRLSNQAVLQGFKDSLEGSFGKSDFNLTTSAKQVDENIYEYLKIHKDIKSVSPRSERLALVYHGSKKLGKIKFIGVDLLRASAFDYLSFDQQLSQADFFKLLKYKAILAPADLTEFLNSSASSVLVSGVKKTLPKALPFKSNDLAASLSKKAVLMDISFFQEFFDTYGRVEGFDLQLVKQADADLLLKDLRERTDEALVLKTPESLYSQLEQTTEAFRLNLHFLAAVSLLTAALLIFHMTSYLVLQRRSEYSILKSLGVSPKSVFKLILLENTIIGFLGSFIGLGLGIYLAEFTNAAVSQTISQLYGGTGAVDSYFSFNILLEVIIIGLLVSLLGAIPAAYEASNSPYSSGKSAQAFEKKIFKGLQLTSWIGMLLIVLGIALLNNSLLKIHIMFGFLPPALISIGLLLQSPALLALGANFLVKVPGLNKRPKIMLALDHLKSTLARNAAASASIALSIGMFIGVAVMINSFRGTVSEWITSISKPDVFVSMPSASANRASEKLPMPIVEWIASNPLVKESTSTGSMPYEFRGKEILLRSSSLVSAMKNGSIVLTAKQLTEIDWEKSIFVSEPFSEKFGLAVGNFIELALAGKSERFQIAAIYQDFSSEHGAVDLENSVFTKLTGSKLLNGAAVYLTNPADSQKFIKELNSSFPEMIIDARDNFSLRQEVLHVFDQTFQITYVLQAISIFIALFVLINSLFMLLNERSREFMSLRALGASSADILAAVRTEAVLLMSFSLLLSYALGLSLSLILVFFINKFFFGWSVGFSFPWLDVFLVSLFSLILTHAASTLAAKRKVESFSMEVLRYE